MLHNTFRKISENKGKQFRIEPCKSVKEREY